MPEPQTRYHVCPLCEAGCGLEFNVKGVLATSVRADAEDVLSKGYVCPKGVSVLELENDPDRLRRPMRRNQAGVFEEISWEEAFATVARRLKDVQRQHGRDAVALYMGTVVIHKYSAMAMRGALIGALRTRNSTGANSQDTSTRFVASYLLYGSLFSIPIPDVDRTAYLLCVGANPLVSNGSLLTAPDIRSRLRGIRERGGKVVVIDPRRTETAKAASEHISIRPGGDAAMLLAMVQTLVDNGRVDTNELERHTRGWSEVRGLLSAFTPERVERHTGVDAATIRRIALEFSDAPSSVAYARIGICNNEFGTLASYAIDLLNLAAGRLGVCGGSMFSTPAIDMTRLARMLGADGYARWHSRVRGLPETNGDIPASTLAEEMDTPGPGQVRAMVTYAGNPVLSVPNGRRLAASLEKLDFMVAIDHYINETTRFADIILPPAGALSEDHLDVFFGNVAVRDVIRWSQPVVPRTADERLDWEILLELAHRLGGGPTGLRILDPLLRFGRRLGLRFSPAATMGLALRCGSYGDWFLPGHPGLNGKKVRAALHGIDLGPLKPGFSHRVFHRDGLINLTAAPILDAFKELNSKLNRVTDADELLLIGRRDLRSNNSWMHNLPGLMGGKPRCLLFVHPSDAQKIGIKDGGMAVLESRVHSGVVPIHVTDEIRPGVVSLPHGWGHGASAQWQSVAGKHAGVSANDWTDDQLVESVVGQSIVNGVPVKLSPVVRPGLSSGDINAETVPSGNLHVQ